MLNLSTKLIINFVNNYFISNFVKILNSTMVRFFIDDVSEVHIVIFNDAFESHNFKSHIIGNVCGYYCYFDFITYTFTEITKENYVDILTSVVNADAKTILTNWFENVWDSIYIIENIVCIRFKGGNTKLEYNTVTHNITDWYTVSNVDVVPITNTKKYKTFKTHDIKNIEFLIHNCLDESTKELILDMLI